MKPQRTYLKDSVRASLSRDELPTPKGDRVANAAHYDDEQIKHLRTPPVPFYTIDEVMSALSDAFPSPRTSRDCVVEKNLRDILSARHNKPPCKPSLNVEDGEVLVPGSD